MIKTWHRPLAIANVDGDGDGDVSPIPSDSDQGSQHSNDGVNPDEDDNNDGVNPDSGNDANWESQPEDDTVQEEEGQPEDNTVQEEEVAATDSRAAPMKVAAKGSRPHPDLEALFGMPFSELWTRGERRGLAMQFINCSNWKHLTLCYGTIGEDKAVRRLQA